VWLREMGLDITLQRVQAYRVFEDKTLITVSQLFPVPDVEEFTMSPQRAELRAIEERQTRTREQKHGRPARDLRGPARRHAPESQSHDEGLSGGP